MNAHARIDIARELLALCQTRLGVSGTAEQDQVYELLLCLRWYTKEQGLPIGQIVTASKKQFWVDSCSPKPKRQQAIRYS